MVIAQRRYQLRETKNFVQNVFLAKKQTNYKLNSNSDNKEKRPKKTIDTKDEW